MTGYVNWETKLNDNCQKSYALIFGQCTEHMRLKLESHEDCQRMRVCYNMFVLMAAIRGITFKFNGHKHPFHSVHNAKQDYFRYNQTGQTKNPRYLETFKNKVLVIEYWPRTGQEGSSRRIKTDRPIEASRVRMRKHKIPQSEDTLQSLLREILQAGGGVAKQPHQG